LHRLRISNLFDYASLAAVAAVVREGSFESAARALSVTPSAVSQRVKQLEERIGSVLIVRGQPCEATAVGRVLCRHAEMVGMLENELQHSLLRTAFTESRQGRVGLRVAVNADSLGTWFLGAMSAFLATEPVLLDLAVDDEEHTAQWLRNSEVIAAVTSLSRAVHGCNCTPLGRMSYVAVASPAFVKRHFAGGVSVATLKRAPSLRFNRKDRLQQQWMRQICRRAVDPPTHWLPSTQAFVEAACAGIAWGMNPSALVRNQLQAGTLVELVPGRALQVNLYWQHTRLSVPLLDRLTGAVVAAARVSLTV
jgi:LysR family transcriptional regulator (chromosome initiation inhibitor)